LYVHTHTHTHTHTHIPWTCIHTHTYITYLPILHTYKFNSYHTHWYHAHILTLHTERYILSHTHKDALIPTHTTDTYHTYSYHTHTEIIYTFMQSHTLIIPPHTHTPHTIYLELCHQYFWKKVKLPLTTQTEHVWPLSLEIESTSLKLVFYKTLVSFSYLSLEKLLFRLFNSLGILTKP